MKLVGSQKQFPSCWKATTASCRVCHQKLLSGERAVKRFLSTPSLPASPPFPTLPSFSLHPLDHLEYLHHYSSQMWTRGASSKYEDEVLPHAASVITSQSKDFNTLPLALPLSSVHLCSPSFLEWCCSKLVLLQAFRGFFVRQQQGDT